MHAHSHPHVPSAESLTLLRSIAVDLQIICTDASLGFGLFGNALDGAALQLQRLSDLYDTLRSGGCADFSAEMSNEVNNVKHLLQSHQAEVPKELLIARLKKLLARLHAGDAALRARHQCALSVTVPPSSSRISPERLNELRRTYHVRPKAADALRALGDDMLTAEEIAAKTNPRHAYDGDFKGLLVDLCKRRILVNHKPGYEKTSEYRDFERINQTQNVT